MINRLEASITLQIVNVIASLGEIGWRDLFNQERFVMTELRCEDDVTGGFQVLKLYSVGQENFCGRN